MAKIKATEGSLWVIVLAGGQGRRLREVTTLRGESVPKQFCSLGGDVSILRRTLQRAARLVPETRIRVVVTAAHRQWWEEELKDLPPACAVVQPGDRGTAAGLLLPLHKIVRLDPAAVVVLMAADHYVERELVLHGSILQGVAIVRADPERVVLLGVAPEEVSDSDFGWIVPSRADLPFGPARVEGFHEKPDAATAAALRLRGALVSSFLLVASAGTLRALFEQHLPDLAGPFGRWRGRWGGLIRLYERIPSRDLSRDLLERSVGRLWVVPVPPCGWSDLGTPERVAHCLRSHRVPASPTPTLLGPRLGFVAPLDLSRQLVGAAGS